MTCVHKIPQTKPVVERVGVNGGKEADGLELQKRI